MLFLVEDPNGTLTCAHEKRFKLVLELYTYNTYYKVDKKQKVKKIF